MPRKRETKFSSSNLESESEEDDTKDVVSLKDRLENMDEKTRRKQDYMIKDFKLQRQHRLADIEEAKQSYLNMVSTYYDKIPKIVPRRFLDTKVHTFELQDERLTIQYKKFVERNKLVNLHLKKELKYGGTPAKVKVTYSATKRKSLARNEVRQFEFRYVSADGSKTVIQSAKKSVRKSRRSSQHQTTMQDQSSLEDSQMLKKQQEYLIRNFKENKAKMEYELISGVQVEVDNFFKRITSSLTPDQLNAKVNEEEQKNIAEHLFGFVDRLLDRPTNLEHSSSFIES